MPEYIIARYNCTSLRASVQYYSTNGINPNHFWSFSHRNCKVFSSLEQAQQAQSFAFEDFEGLTTVVLEFREELRRSEKEIEVGLWADLRGKAIKLGCEIIY